MKSISKLPVHFGVGLNPTQIKRLAVVCRYAMEQDQRGYKGLTQKFERLSKQHPVRGGSRAWWRRMGL